MLNVVSGNHHGAKAWLNAGYTLIRSIVTTCCVKIAPGKQQCRSLGAIINDPVQTCLNGRKIGTGTSATVNGKVCLNRSELGDHNADLRFAPGCLCDRLVSQSKAYLNQNIYSCFCSIPPWLQLGCPLSELEFWLSCFYVVPFHPLCLKFTNLDILLRHWWEALFGVMVTPPSFRDPPWKLSWMKIGNPHNHPALLPCHCYFNISYLTPPTVGKLILIVKLGVWQWKYHLMVTESHKSGNQASSSLSLHHITPNKISSKSSRS